MSLRQPFHRHGLGAVPVALAILATTPVLHGQDPSARLHQLFDEAWAFELEEDPILATSVGENRYNDRLPTVTAADHGRRATVRREFLRRLRAIDRARLGSADQVSYDMQARQLQDAITAYEFAAYEIPILVDDGFHIAFARLPNEMPFETVQDYEHYIARLQAFPRYVDDHVANMKSGMARGFTMPRVVLDGYDLTISSHLVDDPTLSVFYAPFKAFPRAVPAETRARLEQAGRVAIREGVVPGYRSFLDFMAGEYIAAARTSIGASDLPNGAAYYEYLVRHFTTLERSPQAIHELGLAEVTRIKNEMTRIIEEVEFQGDFTAFLDFLRTDLRFYADTPEALLREAAYIAKRMDGKLPSLFGKLPRLPYGVAPVPEHLAPKYTGGRYISAPPGSTQPGYYWVNTYALESRPLYTLPALTLHEAVPGHHLQFALAQEQGHLPPFRRFAYVNAFGEGWGLYAEWLGLEAGIYDDAYSRFGRLTYEMWRACRLVVDTGIHAFGWSRERAMQYMAANTALSLHEVRTETDRYISWPGQALAYKMGELTIRRLRREAEDALGQRFDVRAFHDVVLQNGTVPLDVLETQVRAYVAREADR